MIVWINKKSVLKIGKGEFVTAGEAIPASALTKERISFFQRQKWIKVVSEIKPEPAPAKAPATQVAPKVDIVTEAKKSVVKAQSEPKKQPEPKAGPKRTYVRKPKVEEKENADSSEK